MEKLGIKNEKNYGKIICETDEVIASEIHLDFPSVGATENAILASCLVERKNNYYKCCKRTRNNWFTKFFE